MNTIEGTTEISESLPADMTSLQDLSGEIDENPNWDNLADNVDVGQMQDTEADIDITDICK